MLQDAHPPIHYATNGRRTACGASTQEAVHSDEVDAVRGCQECLDGYNAGLAAAMASLGTVSS